MSKDSCIEFCSRFQGCKVRSSKWNVASLRELVKDIVSCVEGSTSDTPGDYYVPRLKFSAMNMMASDASKWDPAMFDVVPIELNHIKPPPGAVWLEDAEEIALKMPFFSGSLVEKFWPDYTSDSDEEREGGGGGGGGATDIDGGHKDLPEYILHSFHHQRQAGSYIHSHRVLA
jgi:hypothetical protein